MLNHNTETVPRLYRRTRPQGDYARSLLKLIDTLESLDDVQNVTANFELAESLLNANPTLLQ